MKANMRFLKSARLSEFLILESKLFHSIIVEGKKDLLKQSCLTLKRGILFICLVIYARLAVGVNSKRHMGDSNLNKSQSGPYYNRCCRDSKPIFHKPL